MQDTPTDPPKIIVDDDSLKAWLKPRPRQDALIVAARAALRVLPLIVEGREGFADWPSAVVLPVFRACASPWLASHALIGPDAAYATAQDVASAYSIARGEFTLSEWDTTCGPAFGAALAAATANATAAAFNAASTAARDAGTADASGYSWVEADIISLSAGECYQKLRLWHEAVPPPKTSVALARLNFELRDKDNWNVWLDWYQARLDGQDPRPALIFERAVAALTEDDWSQGTAHVNAKLKAAIEAASSDTPLPEPDEIGEQDRRGATFRRADDGHFAMVSEQPVEGIRDDASSHDLHADLSDVAEELLDRCRRSNSLADLAPVVESYIERLGEDVTQTRETVLIQGDRLANRLDVDDAARNSPDAMIEPLPLDAAGALRSLVSAHRLFVAADPYLARRQAEMADPAQTRQKPASPESIEAAIEDLGEILVPETSASFAEMISAAKGPGHAAERVRGYLDRTWFNLTVEITRNVIADLRRLGDMLHVHGVVAARLTIDDAVRIGRALSLASVKGAKRLGQGTVAYGVLEVLPHALSTQLGQLASMVVASVGGAAGLSVGSVFALRAFYRNVSRYPSLWQHFDCEEARKYLTAIERQAAEDRMAERRRDP